MKHRITEVIFSPGGSTEQISDLFCTFAGWEGTEKINLLNRHESASRTFQSDEIAVVASPVFFGRIPEIVSQKLQEIRGAGTPAVAMVVYGNRDYEDALLELTDILAAGGFAVLGAGAFITRHSIFPLIAKDRPDEKDKEILRVFAEGCAEKLERGAPPALSVKGNRPYRQHAAIPFNPKGNSRCVKCGLCAKTCPVQAIDPNTPRQTDRKRCINCTACIYVCPEKARSYGGLLYKIGGMKLKSACSVYKEPEVFL